jgi:transposase
VPSAHAIKTWVNNFEETGSTVKKKGGSVNTVRTPTEH